MTTTVGALLRDATRRLAHSDSAALDAQLLLASVLGKPRSWLYAWPEHPLATHDVERFDQLLGRRALGEPVAYLLGQREFWSLSLQVSPAVLIPRPETELLVQTALQRGPSGPARAADLGTGSGAIALAFAKERPAWLIHATDRSLAALEVASANAARLGLTVQFHAGDWLGALPALEFALIVSNPPYIEEGDSHLQEGDVRFEPRAALVAGHDGLADLRQLAQAAPRRLAKGGWLLLEHGWRQGAAVRELLAARGFVSVDTVCDGGGRERVTCGQWPGASDE